MKKILRFFQSSEIESLIKMFFFNFALLLFAVCVIGKKLILLPTAFILFYGIFILKPNLKMNIVGKIVFLISFLRFCYVPALYTITKVYHLYSWYVPTFVDNELLVQTLMIIELFSIFLALFLYFKKHPYIEPLTENNESESHVIPFRPLSCVCLLATFGLVLLYPKLIPFFNVGKEVPSSISSIFSACLCVSFLYVCEIILNMKRDILKLCLIVFAFGLFILPATMQMNSISRNLLIINSLAFAFVLMKFFSKYKNVIIFFAFLGLLLGFCLLTAKKMYTGGNTSALLGTISIYTNYSYCNSYFAGPTNYQTGLYFIESGYQGLGYIINDMFANLPFVSKYFFNENTVYLYNNFVFHGASQQEILPTGVQSMVYFGPYLGWLLPTLFAILGIKLYDFSKKCKNFSICYLLFAFSIIFSMSQIISVNAVSMLIVVKFLPAFLIVLADLFATKLVKIIKVKKPPENYENVEEQENNGYIIRKNYLFSLFHQLILFAVPLVTTPYISRVLLADGLGSYDFSQSISLYFVMIANLGFGYYAQREIACCKDDTQKRSQIFFEILISKILFTIIALIGFSILIISKLFADYNSLLLILMITTLSSAFDVSFLFKGVEKFEIVSLCQSTIKIVSVICIFVFVKDGEDIPIYALIMNLYSLVSCLVMIPFCKKYISFKSVSRPKIKEHIKSSFILFLPTIFGFFYTSFLKTQIGLLIKGEIIYEKNNQMVLVSLSDIQNGYFGQADKLIQMGLAIVTALGAVMASRNAYLIKKNDFTGFKKNITNTAKFTLLMTIPISFGIIAISSNLVPWFFGDGFKEITNLLKFYPILIVISGLGNVFGLQSLVSQGKFKKFTLGTLAGAIISISVSFFLIKEFMAIGAAISSLLAETCVLLIFILFSKDNCDFKDVGLSSIKYLIAGIIMFGVTSAMSNSLPCNFVYTFLIVFFGTVIYFVSLYVMKDNFVYKTTNKIVNICKRVLYE